MRWPFTRKKVPEKAPVPPLEGVAAFLPFGLAKLDVSCGPARTKRISIDDCEGARSFAPITLGGDKKRRERVRENEAFFLDKEAREARDLVSILRGTMVIPTNLTEPYRVKPTPPRGFGELFDAIERLEAKINALSTSWESTKGT